MHALYRALSTLITDRYVHIVNGGKVSREDGMKFEFECGCGEEVSDFTRGGDVEMSTSIVCEACGSMYAVTITTIQTKFE